MRAISVFGLGPVGLVTAVCFAKRGYLVRGIDTDLNRVEQIRKGIAPFVEPSLEQYLKATLDSGRFEATSDPAVNEESDLTFITVGTPSAEDGSINLDYVKSATVAIGRSLKRKDGHQLVLVKSTVVPGTARGVVKPILEEHSGKRLGDGFGLCSNPEFLREGNAVYDSEYPDRIIMGGEREEDLNRLESFYREFYAQKTPPILRTSYENAELIKYANNSFLAMKVSYINMIANLCQQIHGSDVAAVAKGIGLDNRIGPLFLKAGLGWGGSCFPKDLKALSAYGKKMNVPTLLVDAAKTINENQPYKAVEISENLLGDLKGKRVAVLGLAFKPDTDDMRDAVSVPLINRLMSRGASVAAYDPAAIENAKTLLPKGVEFAATANECINQADCCIIVTEWEEFKTMTPQLFREKMRKPMVVDGRRIFDPAKFNQSGVKFSAIGLGENER